MRVRVGLKTDRSVLAMMITACLLVFLSYAGHVFADDVFYDYDTIHRLYGADVNQD
ncbi:MAG: hypothetical protein JRK53_19365, partial [Deltaproteobacteria bacterium]|nr:hypothetical protein [Deltaproteobacteria bacterium]